MAKPNNGNGGRPKIEIDWKIFESYCAVQCTLREIADYFNCSEDTIERRVKEHYSCGFAEIFKRKRQAGLMSLRANLFKLSEKHPAAAIFMAKNWLGMVDKTELANPEGESFRFEHDAKGKLISAINRLASRTGETKDAQEPEPEGS